MIRAVRIALLTIAVCVLVILFTPIVKWTTEKMSAPWELDNGPVLIVLGGDMLIPGTGPNATLGFDTYLRCVMASLMAHRVQYRYIVVTGAWGLSQSMQRFLVSQGVDASRVLEETAARTTYENAVFTKRILTSRVWQGNPACDRADQRFPLTPRTLDFSPSGLRRECHSSPGRNQTVQYEIV